MFFQLPPVGNPVVLSAADRALPEFLSSPETRSSTRLYASGTAALAAAVCAVLEVKDIENAEVILPAYGCPDLVSAVVYAGAKPVLVDLETERPWLDLALLAAAVNDNTVAIVGVNLFGISERWPQLRELASKHSLLLIEDSAQYFPGKETPQAWSGDLVVLSFGRGKPVSLLGGGAVLCRNSELNERLPSIEPIADSALQRLSYTVKGWLYNRMLSPYIYWLPQSLPFLHLGETRYHVLETVDPIDTYRKALLSANVKRYQDDLQAVRRRQKLSAMLKPFEQIIDLPAICDMPGSHRLLRYPVLLDDKVRDEVYQQLQHAGCGASKMYPASLPDIEGLHGMFDGQSFPAAEDFAARILTLPVHAKLSDKIIVKTGRIFRQNLE